MIERITLWSEGEERKEKGANCWQRRNAEGERS
jgi:hypothetical protein